jgi:hypothetical protein
MRTDSTYDWREIGEQVRAIRGMGGVAGLGHATRLAAPIRA